MVVADNTNEQPHKSETFEKEIIGNQSIEEKPIGHELLLKSYHGCHENKAFSGNLENNASAKKQSQYSDAAVTEIDEHHYCSTQQKIEESYSKEQSNNQITRHCVVFPSQTDPSCNVCEHVIPSKTKPGRESTDETRNNNSYGDLNLVPELDCVSDHGFSQAKEHRESVGEEMKVQNVGDTCNPVICNFSERGHGLELIEKHGEDISLDDRPGNHVENIQDESISWIRIQFCTQSILDSIRYLLAWSPWITPRSGDQTIDLSDKRRKSKQEKREYRYVRKRIPVSKSRKRLSNMIFLFSVCCLIVDISDGSVNYENIIIFNLVMGYLVVVKNLVLGTRKGAFGLNVSLIFGILKSLEGGTQHELDISLRERSLRPSSPWISTKKKHFSESPLVYLGAPGPRTYETHVSREETFRRIYNLPVSASLLAQHGFFWNGQHAQCYSCDSTHGIDDIALSPESNVWHAPTCHLHNRHGSYRARLRQVASDTPGRISDDVRDPPGQQSIYIPPGDVRVESYRLSTFNNYPVHTPMDRKALAKGGFYFTGYSDRVKCFACGRTVERWELSDNPLDLTWHKDSCPHPRGGECGNVPSTNLFARFQGSSSSFNQRNQSLEVLEQRDPRTGEYTRTVRYPTDLPERVRRGGGTFEIGPNNNINIQSGGISHNPGNGEPRMRVSNTNSTVTHQPPRQWRMANVISSDHRRFLNNLYLNRELDRLVSFARWPTGRPTVSPTDLARNGFFYLGDMDRTQCFSCAGVLRNWTANDSARMEHRTHFPNCRFVLGTETRNVPVPMQPESPQERQRRFPCRFPSNPHMRSEATRLDTFDSRWPMGRMAATPEEIARGGFFFLGERDRVKCWYCNGGLQHWDYDDAPWVEHAKWFPNCQFLLSVKGQHFVYRHLTTSAYLSRPIIARQEGATVDPNEEGSNGPPEDIPPPSPGTQRGPTPPPTIVDPREEMRKKEELVEKALKESDIVNNVLAMGFSAVLVRIVLKEKLDAGEASNTTDIYETVSGLLEAVMQKETEEEQRRQNEAASLPGPSSMMPSISSVYSSMTTDPYPSSLGPSPGSGKYNVSLMDEDDDRDMYGAEPMSGLSSLNSVTRAKQIEGNPEESSVSLQEALNKIEEERMCKICFANQADMVFVPCGHMCCCRNCTEAIRHCPVCRVRIEKAIKTYLE